VILTCFEFTFYVSSILDARELVTSLSLQESERSNTSILLIACEMSLIKLISLSLFFAIENLKDLIFSLAIVIETEREV